MKNINQISLMNWLEATPFEDSEEYIDKIKSAPETVKNTFERVLEVIDEYSDKISEYTDEDINEFAGRGIEDLNPENNDGLVVAFAITEMYHNYHNKEIAFEEVFNKLVQYLSNSKDK